MVSTLVKTVSAIAVVDLANELITRGVLSESALQGISADVFKKYALYKKGDAIVEHRLAETHLVSLWNMVDTQSRFAFEVGCTVNQQAKGVLANWISYSDTLAQAFHIFTHNVGLLNHAEQWQLIEDDNTDDVVLEFKHDSSLHYPDLAIERSMVAIIAWANYFVKQPLQVKSASFVYARPKHGGDYVRLLGDHIEFNTSVNRIVLAKSDFYQPLDSANSYLRDVLQQRAQAISLSIAALPSTTSKVMELFVQDLAKYSNIENLLGTLHMSRATLYRKLKNEGATFSELVSYARRDKLKTFKNLTMSSDMRADVLGFSDVSSYYRFIKR